MSLTSGQKIAHYEILEPIGKGGMGEVYKARDLELGRDVALKILPRDLAADSDRVRRFEQEARAASALNHPNIVTIHEIRDHDGTPCIVMEHVKGRTLREILLDGPLPNEKLTRYAAQIAEGLAKAHQAGIVHRDLKPENIIISEDGYAKILDFGLAKLLLQGDADSEIATAVKEDTRPGVILGTVGYMSPEQAKGRPADFRSDQFSFGAIVYEMATGKRAFTRASEAQTLAAIIEDEPELVTLVNPKVAGATARVIDRCLSKDPAERYDSTWDIAKDIHWEELTPPQQPPSRLPLATLASVGILAIVLVMVLGLLVPDVREWVAGKPDLPNIESVAVLPFDNLSGDPEQEYLVDGLVVSLITDLAQVNALRVISATSSMRYRDTEKSASEIASELGVEALVAGSVLRIDDSIRVSVQLIEGSSDEHLWARSYDRDVRNILPFIGSVAKEICDEIEVALTPSDEDQLDLEASHHPEAQDAYLKARHMLNKFKIADIRKSLEYFQQAVTIDPSFARAWAGLSGARFIMGYMRQTPAAEFLPETKEAAETALKLAPDSAEALTSIAWLALVEWDWPTAETAFQRAIELNPNLTDAQHGYGDYLTVTGHPDEGLARVRRAAETDPFSPMYSLPVAVHLFLNRRYDDAIAEISSFTEMNPDYPVHGRLGDIFFQNGMYDEAIDAYRQAFRNDPELLRALEDGYAESSAMGAVRAVAEELAERAAETKARPFGKARWFARAREVDRSLEWLELAYEQKTPNLFYLPAYPEFDVLRSDPRFQDLLRRMNLRD